MPVGGLVDDIESYVLVSLSFYVTKRISYLTWRAIHMLAYLTFVLITVHSISLGTDSSTPVMQAVYLLAAGSVLFLTVFRILLIGTGNAANSANRQAVKGQRVGSVE